MTGRGKRGDRGYVVWQRRPIGAIYLLVCFNFRSLPRRKKCKLCTVPTECHCLVSAPPPLPTTLSVVNHPALVVPLAFPLPLADKLHLSSHFSARSTVFLAAPRNLCKRTFRRMAGDAAPACLPDAVAGLWIRRLDLLLVMDSIALRL